MKQPPILSLVLVLLAAACDPTPGGSIPKGDNYETTVKQADDARRVGDFDSAIPLYGRALQAKPDGIEAKLGLGQSYLGLGAGDEAAAQFRDVLARRSNNPVAQRGLASALLTMGQPALAERQIALAIQADSNDYRAVNILGVALDMQGRHADAQS